MSFPILHHVTNSTEQSSSWHAYSRSASPLRNPKVYYNRSQWPRGPRRGLRPLACWNGGFESRRGYRCLSVVSVVCRQVHVSGIGRSLVQRSSTECVIERDHVPKITLYTYSEYVNSDWTKKERKVYCSRTSLKRNPERKESLNNTTTSRERWQKRQTIQNKSLRRCPKTRQKFHSKHAWREELMVTLR